MSAISWTDEQRQAIRTTGRSIIVSAAAGSGKTAVLAERCAYLVCDAPPDQRCGVDELLVLTFTEAAAAEMRSRIIDYIRARLSGEGNTSSAVRFREQLALADTARISTIHAFCLWIVRRWFAEAGIDPSATVIDEYESELLRAEVLDALFTDVYDADKQSDGEGDQAPGGISKRNKDTTALNRAATVRERTTSRTTTHRRGVDRQEGSGSKVQSSRPDPRPPTPDPWQPAIDNQQATIDSSSRHFSSLADGFVRLVADYGLGRDNEIRRFVLDLFAFTESLPDPDAWLREARTVPAERPQDLTLSFADELLAEMRAQQEYCTQLARRLFTGNDIGHFYAEIVESYAAMLGEWIEELQNRKDDSPSSTLERFDRVCESIRDYKIGFTGAPRLRKDSTPQLETARDFARKQAAEVRDGLFQKRIVDRFARFTVEERFSDLKRTAPFVSVITDLVTAFRRAYDRKKRENNALDFADLERIAFDLLHDADDLVRPSGVAHALQDRFRYVLVDEFQDINPLQEAIIRLAGREADPDRPDNLFVVGDVKQSIYRFRLAEPEVFTRRLRHLAGNGGRAIYLQRNFRSRREILDAVNVVFRCLMGAAGGPIVYDADAELKPGRDDTADGSQPDSVELHLVERRPDQTDGDEESSETYPSPRDDPALLSPAEREALVIGARIREWMSSGRELSGGRRLRYGDIVILLRAAKINAEQMAAMLTAMGIPVHAQVGGSLFATREARDVLAALRVLDNVQQDIPLAAVMRNGLFGEHFTEDELAEIRCHDRDIPFHAVVREYASAGADRALRNRLGSFFENIDRVRRNVRRRPLADVLADLYEHSGYLAYAGGLPGGPQRRANLHRLHDLARRFGAFRQQGLHRFLRFVDALADQQREVSTTSAMGEAENVVRIMSIHRAKGLEFPVVFVAGLGSKFNLKDRHGRMIYERRTHIGLRVVDPERMLEYPSIAHTRAAYEIDRMTREEELRILYVAMTRAREKLVLVGSPLNVQVLRDRQFVREDGESRSNGHAPALRVHMARTPLDWLQLALESAPPGGVRCPPSTAAPEGADAGFAGARNQCASSSEKRPLFDVYIHSFGDLARWQRSGLDDAGNQAVRKAVAHCEPAFGAESHQEEPQLPMDDRLVEQIASRINYVYPHLASTSVPASMAASEFAGPFDFAATPEKTTVAGPRSSAGRFHDDDFAVPASKYSLEAAESIRPAAAPPPDDLPLRRGLVTHRIVQHLDFAVAANAAGVASELHRLTAAGIVTDEELEWLDRGSLEWLVTTDLAAAIREAGAAYRREFSYLAFEPLDLYDRSIATEDEERLLVRGIVDGVLARSDGIEIVEFKTDDIDERQLPERIERYRPQVELYARAMSRLWRKPVLTGRLVFLQPRRIVAVQPRPDSI